MINFSKVSKVYDNNVKALSDIDFHVERGDFVSIIGPSGAGKSTLLRCINRMHDITTGELTVDGIEVNKLSHKELKKFRQRIGMVFQSFNLVSRISVLQNVLVTNVPKLGFFQKLFGVFTDEMKINALQAIDKVGILDKAYTRVDQLSGGQQQRVALARTLAGNPDIILADEPVSSLDPVTSRAVMDDLKRINRDMGITVVMNIHEVDLALEYSDKILGINKGQVIYYGPTHQMTQEILNTIYGGQVPGTSMSKHTEENHYEYQPEDL